MPKVTLSGFIVVPVNELDSVLAELPNHISLTRVESGCISFNVTQCRSPITRFDVKEEFENREAFDIHQRRVRASHWGKVTVNVERHYKIEEESA